MMQNKKPLVLLTLLMLHMASCAVDDDAPHVSQLPNITPDYIGVTVPASIAPLNFEMTDSSVTRMSVKVIGGGKTIRVKGRIASFPLSKWHRILAVSKDNDLTFEVSAHTSQGWITYNPFSVHVSPDPIDYGLTYRLVAPGYEGYGRMGIYERRLSDFKQRAIIENAEFENGCVNCHASFKGSPSTFSLHVRGQHGATILSLDGVVGAYNTKTSTTLGFCVYPYWHPSGRYIAYSSNTTRQAFFTAGEDVVHVYDTASDILIYDTKTGELIVPDMLSRENLWETYPAFSADGKYLYYCAAMPENIQDQYKEVKYNLYRIGFDPEAGLTVGEPELIIDASSQGRSISFPRPSYDGKRLMYTLADYGNFSIWHHEADLWMLDLMSLDSFPLKNLNSTESESFHEWDTSNRWVVFSSRRGDGRHTQLYIAHVSENGITSKPFLLPQRNPGKYYGEIFKSFNVPGFVTGPVMLNSASVSKMILSENRVDFKSRD